LGWRLSRFTQKLIELQHGHPLQCSTLGTDYLENTENGKLRRGLYEADCVVALIAAELSAANTAWPAYKAELERTRAEFDRTRSTCFQGDDWTSVIGACTAFLDRFPLAPAAFMRRAYAHDHRGNLDGAVADYTRAVEVYPGATAAYLSRGDFYERLGRPNLALADFSTAIRIAPRNVQAYVKLGKLYIKQGEFDLAIANYSILIDINPRGIEGYVGRGLAHEAKGQFEPAVADYTKAIDKVPTYELAYSRRAATYFSLG
jgi:tetratricopeptide (TPR) repeat protein